jgi:hypothetical protein
VETGGPHDEQGRAAGDPPERAVATPDNVVLFPRNWFGPPEELVPFGPGASRAALVDAERREVREAISLPTDPPAPLRAEDFWSEGSAAIHHVLQAPAAETEERVAPARTRAAIAYLPPVRFAALTLRRALRACALVLLDALRDHLRPLRRVPSSSRARFLVSAALLAIACVGLALPGLGSTRRVGGESAREANTAVADASANELTSALSHSRAASFRLASRRAEAARIHRRATRPSSPHHPAARPKSTRASPQSSASYSPTVQGIPVSTESGVAAGGDTSGGGSSGTSSSSSSPTAVASSAGSSNQGSAAPPGPQGPGAPFGPGHLG